MMTPGQSVLWTPAGFLGLMSVALRRFPKISYP